MMVYLADLYLELDSGLTYRFFIYHNNRWIFLHKPWKVDYSSLRKKTITEISLSENKSWTHESYIFTIGCSDIYSSHVPLNISTEDRITKMDFYIADRKTIYEDSDYKYQLILETLSTSDADFRLLRIPK